MLRSLPSRKPSSLEDIDLKEKKGSRYDNNNNKMVPPPASSRPPTQTRTSSSAAPGKADVKDHPLNDLYQIIHQPPASTSAKGTSGAVKVESFALHTFVDESGKWVKFRLYGMVEQTAESNSSTSNPGTLGKTGVKREVKTEEIIREEAGPSVKRKRVTSASSSSTSIVAQVRVKVEQEASETEDETDLVPALTQAPQHREQTVKGGMKQEIGVGLWKGYLRLSKIQNPHTPQSIRKSILDGLIHVQTVPGRLPSMTGGPNCDPGAGADSDLKLIISYPTVQSGQTHTPQIVGCQFALLPVQGDAGQGVWGEEGLKGWWEMGCKMISAYNRTSSQLAAIEAQKTRPLPSSTPPSSAGHVPTLSQMAGSSQDRPGLTQRGSGVKAEPTYEDYLGLVKEISMLKMENRQLAQENSALKGGYAGKLSLSQQQQARGSQSGAMPNRGQVLPGMSKIQPGIRRPPKIETGFASSSDED